MKECAIPRGPNLSLTEIDGLNEVIEVTDKYKSRINCLFMLLANYVRINVRRRNDGEELIQLTRNSNCNNDDDDNHCGDDHSHLHILPP